MTPGVDTVLIRLPRTLLKCNSLYLVLCSGALFYQNQLAEDSSRGAEGISGGDEGE